jgi:hypothetical protein
MAASNLHHFLPLDGKSDSKYITYDFAFTIIVFADHSGPPSKAWIVFARSNARIVGSNPNRGMDVCVYSVFVLGTGLATGWWLVQGVLPKVLD